MPEEGRRRRSSGWASRRRAAVGVAVGAALVAAAAASVARLGGDAPREPEAGSRTTSPGARGAKRLPTLLVLPEARRNQGRRGSGGVSGPGGARRPEYVAGQLLVRFEEGTSAETARRLIDSVDGSVEGRVPRIGVRVVDVPDAEAAGALAELEASPAVEYVERDVAVKMLDTVPNDQLWSTQWGPVVVSAPRAWDTTTGASAVVVAVVDTGVDPSHPDLKGATIPGYDFVNSDPDASDDQGHGTAVAGVIAARSNNTEGQAGMCWRCTLMPVKVLDATGSGSMSAVANGIVWAADHGAKVINLSLGGPATIQTLTDAVYYASAKGAVLVGAAGNEGSTSPMYPGAHPQVLSVAATTQADTLYSWSNSGPWVQLAAPGCNTAPNLRGGYVNFCGTSSAAPVVAGLAALALAAKQGSTNAAVEQAIRTNARSIGGAVQHGRIEAAMTLAALGAAPPPRSAPPAPAPTSSPPPAAPSPPPTAPPPPSTPPTSAPETPTSKPIRFRGALTGAAPRRRYTRALKAGRVTATVVSRRGRPLTLTITGPGGRTLARIAGRSPLRLDRTLAAAGTYTFVVGGRPVTRFVLAVSRP